MSDSTQYLVAGRSSSTDLFEQLQEAHNRLDVVRGRIQSDDDVATAVGETIEYRTTGFRVRRLPGCSVVCGTPDVEDNPMATPAPGGGGGGGGSSGLKSERATCDSSSLVITLATAAMTSLASACV